MGFQLRTVKFFFSSYDNKIFIRQYLHYIIGTRRGNTKTVSLTDSIVDSAIVLADDLGPAGWDQEFGHGRINAWRALEPFGLAASPAQISFLVDDDSDPRPASRSINITSASPSDITWTASISPDDGWLAIDPPASGIVSATSSNSVTVMATQPTSYGTHTATLIVTGINASGATIGPATVEVRISYVPDLYENHFPLIFSAP